MTTLSEEHGSPPLAGVKIFTDMFRDTVLKHPNEPAVTCSHQPPNLYRIPVNVNGKPTGTGRLQWTYSELDERSTHLAAALYAQGLRKGMSIATFLHNGIEWMLSMVAITKLNCIFVPLNPRALTDFKTVAHMLKISDIRAVIVQNTEMAGMLQHVMFETHLKIVTQVIVDAADTMPGWNSFSDFMLREAPAEAIESVAQMTIDGDDSFLICFTSGTTALPKACLHANRSLVSNVMSSLVVGRDDLGPRNTLILALPNNHLLHNYHCITQILSGGNTLFPGVGFLPREYLTAVHREKATDIIIASTMFHALLSEIRTGRAPKPTTLLRASLGGSAITAEIMAQCQQELGVHRVRGTFGMSEGSPVRGTFTSNPAEVKRGHTVTVGRTCCDTRIRICAPNSTLPLPRGRAGELHQGGSQMMTGYIGKDRSEDWYTDENGLEWFRTGDEAIMEDDGSISITGRYKEIIIRGGENLSPASIESVLNRTPGLEAIVVPAPDDIAGEVPIAVVKSDVTFSIKELQEAVMRTLGMIFVPEAILKIGELGYEDFPRTLSGKVQKVGVAARVREYRAKPIVKESHEKSDSKHKVLELWAELLGLPEKDIDFTLPVQNFADSITIMRFVHSFQKKFGKLLSVEDIITNPTIQEQITLADSLPIATMLGKTKRLRTGQPTIHDMVHVFGDERRYNATRNAVQDTIGPLGLTWEDVTAVSPGYDHAQLLFKARREHSWVTRSIQMTNVSETKHVRKALEEALKRSPNFHGFYIQRDGYPEVGHSLYVTVRPSEAWFGQIITELPAVENEDELKSFDLLNFANSKSTYPGPMVRIELVRVKQANEIGVIWSMNHTCFDALCTRILFEDFDTLLNNPSADLPYHEDYTLWSDTTFLLRNSSPALSAANYHSSRLTNLNTYKPSLFPPSRAPEWFFGNPDAGWSPSESDLKTYQNPHRKNLNKKVTLDSVDFTVLTQTHLPHLVALRTQMPQLTGAVILKTALALFNVFHTRQKHALYSSLEANRSTIPFLPHALRSRLGLALADAPGPMYTRTVDLIAVDPEEDVFAFLKRMQETQVLLTQNAGAPLEKIYERLEREDGGEGAGDMMIDVMRRQILNWVPGLAQILTAKGNLGRNFRGIKTSLMTDEGFIWIAGMGGPDGSTVYLKAIFDDANILTEEGEEWVDEVSKILLWVSNKKNWYRRVGDFEECLGEPPIRSFENGLVKGRT